MGHKLVDCVRCGGFGKIEQFGHIERGVCFECGGSGKSSPRRSTRPAAPTSPLLPHKKVHLLGEAWFILKTGDHFVAVPEALAGEPRKCSLGDGHAFRVTPSGRVEMSISLPGRLGWGTPNTKNLYGGSLRDWVLRRSGVDEDARADMGPREWDIWLAFLLRLQTALQQSVRR